jgi:hypothetical protein
MLADTAVRSGCITSKYNSLLIDWYQLTEQQPPVMEGTDSNMSLCRSSLQGAMESVRRKREHVHS